LQDVELEVLKQLLPPVHLLFVFPLLEREGALEHHLLLRILELLCRLDEALPVDLLQPVPEDLLLELIRPITVIGCLIDYKLEQADDPLKL
jgi:hypothetical protein